MKTIGFVFLVVFAVFSGRTQPVRTNQVKQSNQRSTNDVLITIDVSRIQLEPKTDSTNSLYQRFRFYFRERSQSLSQRRLHPFNTMVELLSTRDNVQLEERQASLGKNYVKKTGIDTAREVLKDVPLVYRVINQDSFVARLFRDSLGNTPEEEIKTSKNTYSAEEILFWTEDNYRNTNQVSYWRRITGHVEPRYGIRLDYAYAAFTVRRHKETILFGDLRYHYGDLISGDITASDLEALLSFPLNEKLFVSGGILQSIDPPGWNRRWSMKLYQKVDGGRLFLGLTFKDRPDRDTGRVVIGFERLW